MATNQIPAILEGIPHGFLGASFHIEQFDRKSTLLRGFITLTNLTDATNAVVLCLKGPTIADHIEIRDSAGNNFMDPSGSKYNWDAQRFVFAPHEMKRQEFAVCLKDYFDLKPGVFQLLFVFNELQLRSLPKGEFHIKPWSRECLVLRCE